METRDWSLVIFTILTQAAVGAFVVLQFLDRPASRRGRAAVLAVLSVGLFAALFHLATPLEAFRAVVNFGSSWLSREIVFGSLFAGLLTALVALDGSGRARTPLAWLSAVAAVAFLYCQIQIYMMPAQPSWNSFATPAAFSATALRLGILGVAGGLVLREPSADRLIRGLSYAAIFVLVLELLIVPLHLTSLLGDGSRAATVSANRLIGDYGTVLGLRLVLLCAGALSLGAVLLTKNSRTMRTMTLASLGVVFLSELCGRFLFYAAQMRVGL